MSVSGAYSLRPPEVSGALRYERVAQFEAVLTLKEKRRRLRMLKWTAFFTALAIVTGLILSY